ncbi:hexosaminidase [Paenibacillus sp. PastF-3]|uniref:family 20 glycosylhydrolase n=1 Tax=Paenibacillus sp. PastF-3 TaxID=2940626 RepID=UPI00247606E8|nr:family 20 glycosylhydrolase [Paenibacillus sp. PastF-3]MDH6371907.1 hexosaminidase [Paenibacillus sp. PastF-3]
MIHSIHLTGLTEKQLAAVSEVAGILSIRIERSGIPVNCKKQGKGIRISYDEVQVTITYEQEHQLIRALSRFLENIRRGERVEINEMPVYEQLGFMVDCSRNAVLNHEGYKELIRRLALMGYSTAQLYTEDTYELEGYPYFGYLRGRYTGEQIREMDQYAALFGIELVPCIQTLAHLGQALKWQAHAPLVDFQDILLIDDPRTYELIDRMFAFMATHLSSRRINIGMDEAHMMGLGKYLDKHGYQDRFSLMLKHFSTVMEIARKYGFRAMMWSDMFFRLASSGEYYDAESPISPDIVKLIPEEVTLIYWDYYSETQEKYDGMLRKHKQLNDHIGFAGGAWKWMGFAPNNEFSRKVSLLAHDSCVKHGIQEVLITAWGDNGAEASVFSVLPTLQLWAELCYTGCFVENHVKERFSSCVQGNYDDFMALDAANLVPGNSAPGGCSINPAKYLLYQDILCGLFDRHVIPTVYSKHYQQSAKKLEQAITRNLPWQSLFSVQASLCRLLEIKSEIGISIRDAYHRGNVEELAHFSKVTLPKLSDLAGRFMDDYRVQWELENKVFGLDVFDLRMGGMLQRIRTAIHRINSYAEGKVEQIAELEEELLTFDGLVDDDGPRAISANLWHMIATPSVIAGV